MGKQKCYKKYEKIKKIEFLEKSNIAFLALKSQNLILLKMDANNK